VTPVSVEMLPFTLGQASAAQEVTAHPGEINGLLTKLSKEPRGASKKTGETEGVGWLRFHFYHPLEN